VDDQVLGLLRFGMLGLLYLFFGRVMWAVWSQVRSVPVAAGGSTAPLAVSPSPVAVRILEPVSRAGTLDVSRGPVTIGRHPDCNLSLADDTFLSQRHLRVGGGTNGVWVEDLGSTNGTFVDGQRITTRHDVAPGQRIHAGGVVLEVS
jgi:pSer/pThr/pTyr-binding forkhead associated (FHA) protein